MSNFLIDSSIYIPVKNGILHCHGTHKERRFTNPTLDTFERFTQIQNSQFISFPQEELKVQPPIQIKVGDIGVEQFTTHMQSGKKLLAPQVTKENLNDAVIELRSLTNNYQYHGCNWGYDDETIIKGATFIQEYSQNLKKAIVQFKDNSPFGESYKYLALSESYKDLVDNLPKMTQFRNFIRKNQTSLEDTLLHAIDNHYVIGVGEIHSRSQLGVEVGSLFLQMAERTKQKGEELVLAVEMHPKFQEAINNLDYSQPNKILEKKIFEITGLAPGWAGNTANVIIGAKRAGIKVVCIDRGYNNLKEDEKPTAEHKNERDKAMFNEILPYIRIPELFQKSLNEMELLPGKQISGLGLQGLHNQRIYNQKPPQRVIFYGGGYHTSTSNDKELVPLFSLLSKKFGSSVTSFRTINSLYGIDNEFRGKPSVETTMKAFSQKITVVPDTGIIKTSRGSYNYVIIDNSEADVAAFLFRN